MRGKSIVTDNLDRCYVCGGPGQEIHHCIYGCRHKLADEDGLIVRLCSRCHREVHDGDGKLALKLKQDAQKAYESRFSHEAFMQRYGKNYI